MAADGPLGIIAGNGTLPRRLVESCRAAGRSVFVLAFEGEGKVRWFEGNHQAYMEKRRQELGQAADQPHRIKYKRLAQT